MARKHASFTSDLAFQRDVTVDVHTADCYGRLVGEVLLPDGHSLNQELVKARMAWWYRQYAPNDTTLAQLEAEVGQPNVGYGRMQTLFLPGSGGKGNERPRRQPQPPQQSHPPQSPSSAIGAAK